MDDRLEDQNLRATNGHRSHTTDFQFAGQRAQMGKAPATKPGCDPWGPHDGRRGPVHAIVLFLHVYDTVCLSTLISK